MSELIEDHIKRIAGNLVETEIGKISQIEVKPSLADTVSAAYEHWVKLLEAYSSTAKRDGYGYLAGVLTENYGIEVSAGALRKAVSSVRKRRGERVFKKDGQPYKNKSWELS